MGHAGRKAGIFCGTHGACADCHCICDYKDSIYKKYVPVNIAATLLAAGALGNFIDRCMYGYVRDFIYFRIIDFPVFNIADIYVTAATVLFIIVFLFVYKDGDFAYLLPGKPQR